jgi:TolB-like protein/Flp pilus assembly protein TadD
VYGFFSELKRRKVYRAAAAYSVGAWALIQFAATIFPVWDLPIWTLRLVIVVALVGFPIALLLGWAFEITSTGIQQTRESVEPGPESEIESRGRKSLLLLAAVGLMISIVAGVFILPRAVVRRVEKSIAVLPFENFSDNKENEFFADGIQDDILTNLAKISDLKVISRTSVMSYRGSPKGVRQIAKALGVSTILEGSVQRDQQNRVRVNVQLIDAYNDRHLWAQAYDRELTDVFAIQSELAQKIASALKATLSPDEQQRIGARPTENSEAYLLYLQAHDIYNRPDRRHDDLARAESLYDKAIQLDPSFALAYARLSQLESWMYYAIDPAPGRKEKARAAASEALRLQPNLAEAHLASGLVSYYLDRDYDRALSELAAAQDDLPNDAVVARIIAAIQRREGRWRESTISYQKAASLDPKDPILLENMGWNFLSTRSYPEAAKIFDRAVKASPNTFTIRELRARVDFYERGDLNPMAQVLETTPESPDPNGTILLTRYNYEMFRRNFAGLIKMLDRSSSLMSRGETSAPIPKSFLQANAYDAMKDKTNAKIKYEEARKIVEEKVSENPNDAPRHALLGLIYAGLGQCTEAVAEADRALGLLPETKDAFDGPILTVSRARVAAKCGDADKALEILERSLEIPAGVTVSELQFDPTWDPLRNNPRFKRMFSKHATTAKK